MKEYAVPEISEDVYLVGVRDWNRRIFDALIPLPQGTSYNSYVVRGIDKTALIDTVGPGFESELQDRVAKVADFTRLDYLIMNHAEPDHSAAIPYVMQASSSAVLMATAKGAKVAQDYYKVPESRIRVVKDGEQIELGGKTLRFIEAPLLHWPETMFTYVEESGLLFPCDFLGAHTAFGLFDTDVDEIVSLAKKYFGEIMMPFRNMALRALGKLEGLDIRMIAPSHGPIYKNPQRILGVSRKWAAGETEEKVIALYVTMWKSTEAMIKAVVETLLAEGIEVGLYDLLDSDLGEIAKDLVDSRSLLLGTPAVLGGMHPLAVYATYLTKMLRPPLKYAAVVSSYGWGGGAVREATDLLALTRVEMVGSVELNRPPSGDDFRELAELGKRLAEKTKS